MSPELAARECDARPGTAAEHGASRPRARWSAVRRIASIVAPTVGVVSIPTAVHAAEPPAQRSASAMSPHVVQQPPADATNPPTTTPAAEPEQCGEPAPPATPTDVAPTEPELCAADPDATSDVDAQPTGTTDVPPDEPSPTGDHSGPDAPETSGLPVTEESPPTIPRPTPPSSDGDAPPPPTAPEPTEPESTEPESTEPEPTAPPPPTTTDAPGQTTPPAPETPETPTAPSIAPAAPADEPTPEPPTTMPPELTHAVPATDTAAAGGDARPVEPAQPATHAVEPSNPWTTEGGSSSRRGVPGPTAPVPGRTPRGERSVPATEMDVILATIRQLESGGRYHIGPNSARASGAYQFVPSTWNGYGGYAEAYLAPPSVQDAKARTHAEEILRRYGGQVAVIPLVWYWPLALRDLSWMDRVPNPRGGNRLTVRQYQTKWLEAFTKNREAHATGASTSGVGPAAVSVLTRPSAAPAPEASIAAGWPFAVDDVTVSDATIGLALRAAPPAELPSPADGSIRQIAFPVLGPVVYGDTWGASRDNGARTHVGTDLIAVPMQPILAAVDGTVVRIQHESRGISGVAISIRDDDGWRYNYFHGNNDTPGTDDGAAADAWRIAPGVRLGQHVVAGQIIGFVGDSGNAERSVAHLHFEIRDPTGAPQPSFASLRAAQLRQACTIGIGPWSTPVLAEGADLAGHTVSTTTVTPLSRDGVWTIDSDGRVTATGDAALIAPAGDLDCVAGPQMPFGTDAAGWMTPGAFDIAALDGTVLEGVDLAGTPLEDVVVSSDDARVRLLADREVTSVAAQSVGTSASAVDLVDPIAATMTFRDPSTGEMVIVVVPDLLHAEGSVRPAPACREETSRARRPAGRTTTTNPAAEMPPCGRLYRWLFSRDHPSATDRMRRARADDDPVRSSRRPRVNDGRGSSISPTTTAADGPVPPAGAIGA